MISKQSAVRVIAKTTGILNGYPFRLFAGLGHILMFHRVLPLDNRPRISANAYLEVTPDYLDRTIRHFKRHGYSFMSIEALHSGGYDGRRPFVCYTFDDGFADNLTYAFPVFKAHSVPFSVYVTTGFPDRTAIIWWNSLEKLLLERTSVKFTMFGESYSFPLKSLAEKSAAFNVIAGILKNSHIGTIVSRSQQFFGQVGVDPLAEVRSTALSWEQLRTLSAEPLVTIGAHTVTHPVLCNLDRQSIEFELGESKRRLEEKLDVPVTSLAYPFGGIGEIGADALQVAGRLGFRSGLTTMPYDMHRKYFGNMLFMPRIAVGMSMTEANFDLIRYGIQAFARNRGTPLARYLPSASID